MKPGVTHENTEMRRKQKRKEETQRRSGYINILERVPGVATQEARTTKMMRDCSPQEATY